VNIPGVSIVGTLKLFDQQSTAAVNQAHGRRPKLQRLLPAGPYSVSMARTSTSRLPDNRSPATSPLNNDQPDGIGRNARNDERHFDLAGLALSIPTAGFVITPAGLRVRSAWAPASISVECTSPAALKLSITTRCAGEIAFSAGGTSFTVTSLPDRSSALKVWH